VLLAHQDRTPIPKIVCFQHPSSARASPLQDRPVHQANADSQAILVVLAILAAMDVPVHQDSLAIREHLAKAVNPDQKAHLASPDRRATQPTQSLDALARVDSLDDLDHLASQEHLEATATTASPDVPATTDAQVLLDALDRPENAASPDHPARKAAATNARLHVWRQAIKRRTQALNSHAPCDCAQRHITSPS